MTSDGLVPPPYFLENEEWYTEVEDDDNFCVHYELTELGKSIHKVVKSFEEFHKSTFVDDNGDTWDL